MKVKNLIKMLFRKPQKYIPFPSGPLPVGRLGGDCPRHGAAVDWVLYVDGKYYCKKCYLETLTELKDVRELL